MAKLMELDLQLFADGGAGGEGGAGGAAEGGEAGQGANQQTGVQAAIPARRQGRKANPLANVKYGMQDAGQAPAAQNQAENAQGEASEGETFEQLIKGKYKDDYAKSVQTAIRDRFKKNAATDAQVEKLLPVLNVLSERYGLASAEDFLSLDAEALGKAVQQDHAHLEKEAMQRGMPVESLAELKMLQAKNEAYDRQRQQQAQMQKVEAHLMKLMEQEAGVKQLYPGFDLRTELNNPEFKRLTSPGVNVPVQTAYEIVHKDEIITQGMQIAAKKSAEKISRAVQSGTMRMPENALQQQSSVVYKNDPRTLTKQDHKEINRRALAGEKIKF